jgi:hypothetical protein
MNGGKMDKTKINAQIMLAFNADIVNSYNPKRREVILELNSPLLNQILESLEN